MPTESRRHVDRAVAVAVLLAGLMPPVAGAAEAEPPPVEAQATYQVAQPEGLAARLLGDTPSPVRALDSAIFTGLSPVTASEPALRLPEDQQDDE